MAMKYKKCRCGGLLEYLYSKGPIGRQVDHWYCGDCDHEELKSSDLVGPNQRLRELYGE